MKFKVIGTLLLLLSLPLITKGHFLFGQGGRENLEIYNWFDGQVTQLNTGLFNGIKYIELYRTINQNHKFYETSEFREGSIVYEGQNYGRAQLKYDLDADEVLINIGYNYRDPTLILFKSKVGSFSIGKSDFIRIEYESDPLKTNGYYQVLVQGDSLSLLKKNRKKRLRKIKGRAVYYEFLPNNSYWIKHSDSMREIKGKRDLVKIWPDKREFINANYNPALKENNEDGFWVTLVTKLLDSFKNKSS